MQNETHARSLSFFLLAHGQKQRQIAYSLGQFRIPARDLSLGSSWLADCSSLSLSLSVDDHEVRDVFVVGSMIVEREWFAVERGGVFKRRRLHSVEGKCW